jgi:hypothetical protein
LVAAEDLQLQFETAIRDIDFLIDDLQVAAERKLSSLWWSS